MTKKSDDSISHAAVAAKAAATANTMTPPHLTAALVNAAAVSPSAYLQTQRKADIASARRDALAEAARLIEANSILYSAAGGVLQPRLEGDRSGLAYAAAIRFLISREDNKT